jgi:hypothetical protein
LPLVTPKTVEKLYVSGIYTLINWKFTI